MGRGDVSGDACRAWQLLVKFFFAQREHLPSSNDELDLSPAQCHVLHLIEPDAGNIVFDGDGVDEPQGISARELRLQMQMVFQDSYSSLNPRATVADIIAFGPRTAKKLSPRMARERAERLLDRRGLCLQRGGLCCDELIEEVRCGPARGPDGLGRRRGQDDGACVFQRRFR